MDQFSQNLNNAINKRSDRDSYEYYEDTHQVDSEYTSRLNSFRADTPRYEASVPTFAAQGGGNFMVYKPRSADDVQTLIDHLKTRDSAIINLDDADPDTAQRVLDFVSGAIYALNGTVSKISGNIFLLSPEGVGVTGANQQGNRR